MRKDTGGAGAVCRGHMLQNNPYLEHFSAEHGNNLFSAQNLQTGDLFVARNLKT